MAASNGGMRLAAERRACAHTATAVSGNEDEKRMGNEDGNEEVGMDRDWVVAWARRTGADENVKQVEEAHKA